MARHTSAENFKGNHNKLKGAVVVGLGSAAMTAMMFGAGFANAETHAYVGGAADPGSQGPVDTAIAQGRYNPNANNIQIQYPAGIAPAVGDTQMIDSVNQGAQSVVDAYHNSGGDDFTCEGFSLGAIVCDAAGNQVMAENGGNVPSNYHNITEGNADAQSGLFQNPLTQLISPILPAFGVDTSIKPIPGTINRFYVKDFWGNGNQPDIVGNIEQLNALAQGAPDGHAIPDPNAPHQTYVGPDDVVNEVYGQSDVAVVGALDPAQNPVLNPDRLYQPEFFGEAPCVAPDGTNYFTPGDAPC
jgi:hypothetical protein